MSSRTADTTKQYSMNKYLILMIYARSRAGLMLPCLEGQTSEFRSLIRLSKANPFLKVRIRKLSLTQTTPALAK